MSDNLYEFKKRMNKDYINGPVKVFTQEEIDEWTRTRYDEVWQKIQSQQGMSEADIRYLDSMTLMQEELRFQEVMEGTKEGNTDGIT